MNIGEVVKKATEELAKLTKLKPEGVIGTSKDEKGWKVTIQMLEKKSIPDAMDLFGIYEVLLDEKGEVVKFERIELRKRGDTEKEEE